MKFKNICWLTILFSVIYFTSAKSSLENKETHVAQKDSSLASNLAQSFVKDNVDFSEFAIGSTRKLLGWGWVIKAGKWV